MDVTPTGAGAPSAGGPAGSVDLTPRTVPGGRRSPRRKWGAAAALAAVGAIGGDVLWQGLANATLSFSNADEVGVRSACMPDDRFRLQGTVVPGSVVDTAESVDFDVTYGGVVIPVHHSGDAPSLFQEDIPVVLEGRYDGQTFDSDRILVKHTEEYRADNPNRVPAEAP